MRFEPAWRASGPLLASLILAIPGLFGASAASGQSLGSLGGNDKTVRAVRVDTGPMIDGRLDDPVWQQAIVIEDLHQLNPVEYAEPSERTEIRVLYDDSALYVSARLWDRQPDRITAQVLRQGEGLGSEDRFAIIIDPYLDRRSGYRFQVNPNGVRWDALYQNTTELESNWEGIWQAAATRDDGGWTAEMAIPFKTLSFNPANDAWGVNFERTIQRNDETLGWVSRNRQLNPSVAGTMTGFEGLQQGRGLDVVPSAAMTSRRTYGATASSTSNLEPSLDIFYKITPSLNAAFTLNTDFSATEVDDRQVNLSRFSLFFPEKRDFFLQDADIFEFGGIGGGGGFNFGGGGGGGSSGENGRPFFSRRLGLSDTGQPIDIDYGGKLSGRIGRWNVGALAIHQAEYEAIDEANVFVGRVSANVLEESAVGMIVTEGDPQSNLESSLAGTDFRYRNTRLPGGRVLEGQAWYQETNNEGVTGDNHAFGFGVSAPNNTGWRGGFDMKQIEANFDPAVGFVNEAGIRDMSLDFGYRFRPTNSWLRSIYPSFEASRVERLDTGLLDRQSRTLGLNMDNNTQDRLFINLAENEENIPFDFPIYVASDGSGQVVIPAGNYSWTNLFGGLRTGNQRHIAAFLGLGHGGYYDGHRTNINTNLRWRPSERLSLNVSYQYSEIDLPDGSFEVRLSSFSAQFVFSSTLSWVNLIQYDNFSETIGINSRLHWIPEAGREGFIVFNHSLSDPDKNDSFRSTNADVSVKFSYTFRF